jgi:predicted nucleic acid-binding protein
VSEIVYLDLCCFKRPFDDATVERIRREAEAVAAILDAVKTGKLQLVRSPAHDFENERNPREDRRLATRLWLETALLPVTARPGVGDRARELEALGFGALDALHLAFAEEATAGWFVTTDDRLVKRARSLPALFRFEVVKPDDFLLETPGVTQ